MNTDILFVIALAARRGYDPALTEAIELGLIDADQHSGSEDWLEALAAASDY